MKPVTPCMPGPVERAEQLLRPVSGEQEADEHVKHEQSFSHQVSFNSKLGTYLM